MALYSSTIRYTGLSGVDTEGMVRALMNAESMKYNNLKTQTQVLQWKQDAYRDVAEKMKSFQSSFLDIVSASSLRKVGTFSSLSTTIKKSSGEVSSLISVKTSDKTVAGKHTLKVNSVAKKDVYVSDKSIGGIITGGDIDDTLAYLEKATKAGEGLPDGHVKLDTPELLLDKDGKPIVVLDVDGKPMPNMDENGNYVSTVDENDDPIPVFDTDGSPTLGDDGRPVYAFIYTDYKQAKNGDGRPIYDGDNPVYEINYSVKDAVSFTLNYDNVKKNISLNASEISDILGSSDSKTALIDKLNDKLKNAFGEGKLEFYKDANDNLNFKSLQAGHGITMSLPTDGSANFLEAMGTTDKGHAQPAKVEDMTLADAIGLEGDANITIKGVPIEVKSGMTVGELINEVNKIDGVKMSYSSFTQGFRLESTATGAAGKITWGSDANDLFAKLGFSSANTSHISEASDAEFEFDGVKTSRSTNSFTISNIDITLDPSNIDDIGKDIIIDVQKDTQSTMDTIKKFVDAYNALISDINGMTTQNRAKKDNYNYYEPLSDEQKEEMSEGQIEKWESKAKEGILRRDDILNGITSSMRSWLYESVDLGGGKKISLYEIGITTSRNYRDQGKLIIDETRLAKALTDRPEDVLKLFTQSARGTDGKLIPYGDTKNKRNRMKGEGIAERLNDLIEDAISGTGTIAQKAGIKGQLSEFTSDLYYRMKEQDEKVSKMLKDLTRKENNYYLMFSKMEAAMTQSNSQAQYLAAQLGG